MTIVLNGTTGITNDGGYTGDGVVFADTTPSNTLVTTTGGNVGIGTSSPASKLNVSGGTFQISNSGTEGSGWNYNSTVIGYDLSNGYGWITAANASARTNLVLQAGGGNVGIGTSSPAKRLSVVNATDATTVGTNAVMSIQAGSSVNSVAEIGFSYGSWGGTNPIASIGYQITSNAGVGAGALTFSTRSVTTDTAPTERARIDSSGNLLVNTTTNPGTPAKFVVSGNSDGAFNPMTVVQEAAGSTSRTSIQFYRNSASAVVGSITTTNTATGYGTSSDYRLKNTIAPMTGALAKVAALKPCTYKWNTDGSDGEGFIAHELAEVVPQAVSGEKDAVNEDGSIKPQSIDTSFLVATLTAAIQEQQAIITALTARVAALEGQA